ncbi:wall-associated receptor kinase-like 20 [Nymphaea colorata]|nr:wall-associated receptor kinase-like 20 [Nymphaea colorata]
MEGAQAPLHQWPSTGISIFCVAVLLLLSCSAAKQCGNCGSTPVPYPLSTSPGCGDPNYPVICNTSTGALFLRSISGTEYPITSIDPQSQTFILQPARLIGNSCQTTDFVYEGVKLNHSLPFNFTTDNTVFLLNCSVQFMNRGLLDCSTQSSNPGSCWAYLKQAPPEMASCRSSNICCSGRIGGTVSSYNIIARSCTAYRSFVNLDDKLPVQEWQEGVQVQWASPPELECQNQTDCWEAVPNSRCLMDRTAAGDRITRCICNAGLQWDPKTGTCTKSACRERWRCHEALYIALVAGLASTLTIFLMFIGFCLYNKKILAKEGRERLRKEREEILSLNSGGRSAKLFSGKDMKKATNSFSPDRLLGEGGFGEVYKGFLEDGTPIAAKIAKVDNTKGTDQVLNEVSILSQVNHRSLVRLLGCCVELEQPVMVYEFIPNGTLHEHIHTDRYAFLSWHQRLRIASQTAEGLAYLHSSAMPPIYHRDVKSSNILLDDKCNAKVSDFGLSRLIDPEQTHVSTCVQGTIGYLDPEYYRNYQLTDKSDVYSFGVVLLELLTSKKVIDRQRDSKEVNLFNYVQHRVDEGKAMEVVDEKLKCGASPRSLESMKTFCSLAMGCLEERRQDRPSMKEVAEEIQYLIISEQAAAPFASMNS